MGRVLIALALLGLASVALTQERTLIGTATYRHPSGLPADAVLVVRVIEEASEEVLAETRFRTGGKQVPIPFRLGYRVEAVDAAKAYRAQVEIEVGGRVRYATPAPVRVTLDGKTRLDAMLFLRVDEGTPSPGLVGTTWELTELRGVRALPGLHEEPLTLTLGPDAKMSGFGGVNRFSGGYGLEGDRLTFSPVAVTRMAGPPELIDQERRFVAGLEEVVAVRLEGSRLEFLDRSDRPVARFRAKPARGPVGGSR